jgi:hypothetical protein
VRAQEPESAPEPQVLPSPAVPEPAVPLVKPQDPQPAVLKAKPSAPAQAFKPKPAAAQKPAASDLSDFGGRR